MQVATAPNYGLNSYTQAQAAQPAAAINARQPLAGQMQTEQAIKAPVAGEANVKSSAGGDQRGSIIDLRV